MPIPLAAIPAGISLAGGIASLFSGGNKAPTAQELEEMFGTGALSKEFQQLFQLLASNPAFQNQLAQLNLTGQNAGQTINANLASSGLSTSGIGALGTNLGSTISGLGQSQAVSGLSAAALQGAQGNLDARQRSFTQLRGQEVGQPTASQNLFGNLLSSQGPGLAQLFAKTKTPELRPAGIT